jgi:hypothetical protein
VYNKGNDNLKEYKKGLYTLCIQQKGQNIGKVAAKIAGMSCSRLYSVYVITNVNRLFILWIMLISASGSLVKNIIKNKFYIENNIFFILLKNKVHKFQNFFYFI